MANVKKRKSANGGMISGIIIGVYCWMVNLEFHNGNGANFVGDYYIRS
jgi:uncharacterized membrane protein YkvI